MDGVEYGKQKKNSILLELAASDDLIGFKTVIKEEVVDVDESGYWYGKIWGSRKMGFEERTPLMVASMFGSKQVLNYILQTGGVDVNKACGSDGATALHCAVAGGADTSLDVVKLLLDASADVNCVDANGNRPIDMINKDLSYSSSLKRNMMDLLLRNNSDNSEKVSTPRNEKKEFPVDLSLPDIKNGIYGTDEFRMYMFKVKPCSRAYSHDWTECPFVHPGENARRRDPIKYHYTCVPCPEFRKGTCRQGDSCEYAHGIFECWLHPAQYRTRLCKDETGCARKVCFFAHKPEELRPLYASTGSAVPSPRSMENTLISSFALGSPPSPIGGSMWSNQPNLAPPTLHLSGSRLKTTRSFRDLDFDENYHSRQQQMTGWNAGSKHTNLDDIVGSLDPSILYQLQGLSMDAETTQLRQNMNPQIRTSYPLSPSCSPMRPLPSFGKRSQSFIDRSSVNHHSGFSSPVSSPTMTPSSLSDWGSPNGKLDWGVHKEEMNKFRKSASFGLRTHEPNLPWVESVVEGRPPENNMSLKFEEHQHEQYHPNHGGSEMISPWVEQLYMDQEHWVA